MTPEAYLIKRAIEDPSVGVYGGSGGFLSPTLSRYTVSDGKLHEKSPFTGGLLGGGAGGILGGLGGAALGGLAGHPELGALLGGLAGAGTGGYYGATKPQATIDINELKAVLKRILPDR